MKMRWQALWVCLLLAGFVSAGAREAKAQYGEAPSSVNVYTNTYIYFDDENGVMYGEADAYTDYLYSVYYTISVYADLEGDNGDAAYGGNYDSGQGESHPGATAYAYLEAKADTKYTVTGTYDVTFGFEDEYDYFDYYNFQQYEFSDVHALDWYDFYGYFVNNYPPYGGGSTNAHLASTHSDKKTGVPHHVKVYSDVIREVPNCGARERTIKYQIVDSSGKGVGTTSSRELFRDQQQGYVLPFVNNTCAQQFGEEAGLEAYIYPSECSVDQAGIIADGLFVGCTGGVDCGPADFIDSWITCQSGKPEATVTTNTYHARSQEMLINNVFQYAKGTQLY